MKKNDSLLKFSQKNPTNPDNSHMSLTKPCSNSKTTNLIGLMFIGNFFPINILFTNANVRLISFSKPLLRRS